MNKSTQNFITSTGEAEDMRTQSSSYRATEPDIWRYRLAQILHKPGESYKFKETRLTHKLIKALIIVSTYVKRLAMGFFPSFLCSKEQYWASMEFQNWDKIEVDVTNSTYPVTELAFKCNISIALDVTLILLYICSYLLVTVKTFFLKFHMLSIT